MTGPDQQALDAAYGACEALVRDRDPDRAVSVGFAPDDRRGALFALYAFYVETASIRDHVREPIPGEIRLQWWRDRIAAARTAPHGEGAPLAMALLDTINRHALPADAFDRLLDARIFDLYDDPMGPRGDFEGYAGETASALIVLAAMILDRTAASGVAGLAGHAGVAQTASAVLRSAGRDTARGQVFPPSDILQATGVSSAEWLGDAGAAERVRVAMRHYAADHRARLDEGWPSIPRSVRPAFLPALLASRSDVSEEPSPLSRLWFYWRAMRR